MRLHKRCIHRLLKYPNLALNLKLLVLNNIGLLCDTINCNMQPTECSSFKVTQCNEVPLYNYCPGLCGRCSTTTITTTTATTTCPSTPCFNGASFSSQLCRCSCFPAYTGSLCETLMCDKQPAECGAFVVSQCSGSSVQYYCNIVLKIK